MDRFALIARLVSAIPTVVNLVDKLQEPGATKKQKAIDAIPQIVGGIEAVSGHDYVNDTAVLQLRDAAIDAYAAAQKALDAYHHGLINKAQQ